LLDTVRVAKEEGDENFIELAADDCFQLFLVNFRFLKKLSNLDLEFENFHFDIDTIDHIFDSTMQL
jgi:hypothetical protein